VGGSKSCGVSWIDFDEEASFFTQDEVVVLGFTDHRLAEIAVIALESIDGYLSPPSW